MNVAQLKLGLKVPFTFVFWPIFMTSPLWKWRDASRDLACRVCGSRAINRRWEWPITDSYLLFDQRAWVERLFTLLRRSPRLMSLFMLGARLTLRVPFNTCGDCGNAYQNYPHTPDSVKRYYESSMRGTTFADRGPFHAEIKQRQARYFLARTHLHKGARILDIGAAEGIVCAYFETNGYEGHGIEPSKAMVDFGRQKHGLTQLKASFYDADSYPPDFFDGMICHHVAEHLFSFDELIEPVKKHLKPGGFLLVQVPNLDEPSPRVFAGPHLVAYSRRGLERLLESHGFKVIEHQAYPYASINEDPDRQFAPWGSPPGGMSILARRVGPA